MREIIAYKKRIFEDFAHYLTPARKQKIEANVQERTRWISLVLEDVYQAHNTSAALRTADCFGIQDIHIIESRHVATIDEAVAKGASQWLTIHQYRNTLSKLVTNVQNPLSMLKNIIKPEENVLPSAQQTENEPGVIKSHLKPHEQPHEFELNELRSKVDQRQKTSTEACFSVLKEQGYTIVATTPHERDMLVEDLPIDQKLALVFGTEQHGLSDYAMKHADVFVKVPMYGFTESFNISVCVGIILYELTKRLRESDVDWHLSDAELIDLQLEWLGKSTYRTHQINEKLQSFKNSLIC